MRELLERLVGDMVASGIDFMDARREFDKRFISRVLQAHDGNLTKAAHQLGMHRNTLARQVKTLKIRTR